MEKGYNPLAFRFMCLLSNYRKQLIFSYDILDQMESQYDKLKNKISLISDDGEYDSSKFNDYNDRFIMQLSNDLNTANCITLLYDLLKDNSVNGHTKREIINSFDKVLSLDLTKEDSIDSELDKYVMAKIEERNLAKRNKDYSLADSIRNELLEMGITLIDTREGTIYKRN